MYVCIIARGIPTEKYKMNGIFEYDQAKALAKAGAKVVYIALDLRSVRRWRKWGITIECKDGIIIYKVNVPIGGVPDKILCGIGSVVLQAAFKKVVCDQGKPEIVHAHFIQQAYMATKIREKYGLPFVVTEHSDDVNKEKISTVVSNMANIAYKQADIVISVSQALKARLDEKFGLETRVISNIINFGCFQFVERKITEEFCFISVGGLVSGKRMEMLVEAFYQAFGASANTKLVIYGEGPERNFIEKKIEHYNLKNCVILKGLQERQDIYEKMQECQCFVLASEAETFGMAYVEAMVTGLPVIATACGGPEEFVNEYTGILIPKNDVEELRRALVQMRKEAFDYDSRQISEYVLNKYSNEHVIEQLMEVYEEVKQGD